MWPTFPVIPHPIDSDLDLVVVKRLLCGVPTITYRPSTDTPTARSGDLVVVIMHSDGENGGNAICSIDNELWTFLMMPGGGVNTYRQYGAGPTGVLYTFLTADTLTTQTTFVHSGGTGSTRELCASAYVFRNADPDIPLDCPSYMLNQNDNDVNLMFAPHGPAGANRIGDYQFAMLTFDRSGTVPSGTPFPSNLVELSPPLTDLFDTCLRNSGAGYSIQIRAGLRKVTDPARNLFSGEDFGTPMIEWTPVGLDLFDITGTTYAYRRLRSNSATNKHYAEKRVVLAAGQKYSWHTLVRNATGSFQYAGLTVTPPSGAEFGVVHRNNNSTNGAFISAYLDPAAGHEDWWYGMSGNPSGDGLANQMGYPVTLCFTAQEAGEYAFRVYAANGGATANLTHTTANLDAYVFHTALILDYCSPIWVPYGALPTEGISRMQKAPLHYLPIGDGRPSEFHGAFSWCVNKRPKPGERLNRAVMLPYCAPLGGGKLDVTGLQVRTPYAQQDQEIGMVCSRLAHPTRHGERAAYYAELNLVSRSGSPLDCFLGVGMLHQSWGDSQNSFILSGVGIAPYRWNLRGGIFNANNTEIAANAWPFTPGSKIGVLLDYRNDTVSFYLDGTLQASAVSLVTTFQHQKHAFMLCVYSAIARGAFPGHFTYDMNLAGPFGGRKPTGAYAWDWPNEVQ